MDENLTLWINGLPFKGWGQSQQGFNIRKKGLSGWQGAAKSRREELLRQRGDGAYAVPSFLSPRVVSVSGFCKARSMRELGTYLEQLEALNAPGVRDSLQVVVEEFGSRRWAIGTFADGGAPDHEPFGGYPRADFDFILYFADPLKYGETNRFPETGTVSGAAAIDVFHRGTYASSPKAIINGSGSNSYALYGPGGRRFFVDHDLTSGHPHIIDLATGTLTIDGINVSAPEPRSWALPGQTKVAHNLDPNGNTMSMYLTITDTF